MQTIFKGSVFVINLHRVSRRNYGGHRLGRMGDVINGCNWPEQPRPPEKEWTIWRRLLRVFVTLETT
jgi:hypothetical protein